MLAELGVSDEEITKLATDALDEIRHTELCFWLARSLRLASLPARLLAVYVLLVAQIVLVEQRQLQRAALHQLLDLNGFQR